MDEENKTSEAEQIKKLLEQNLALTKEIYRMTKKIKNYVAFQKVMSVIYLLLIVVALGLFDLWADFRKFIRPAPDPGL